MRFFVVQICILVFLVGCKKETTAPVEKAAAETPKAEVAPQPKKAPIDIPGAKGSKPLPRDNRSANAICMRACNKAQQCGTSSGSVTSCVEVCLNAIKATDENGKVTAQGFRAQDRCASKSCAQFDKCVGHALLGEKALAKNPAIAPDKAEAMCRELCDQETRCHPKRAKQRGDIKNCLVPCKSVLINPSPDVAHNRAMMTISHGCLDQDCKLVEECSLKAVNQK